MEQTGKFNTNLNDQKLVNLEGDEYSISAIYQEIFNRILPAIRHDIVGHFSACLMRVSIMDRHLHREETTKEQLALELKKIETHLKEAVTNIREFKWWDFDSKQKVAPSIILKNCVRLMSSQLTTKGIQLTILPGEDENREIYTKPLLYTLLSLFCYFEDKDFVNLNLNIYQNLNTISITFEPLPAENLPTFVKQRNPIFSSDLVINFARIHQIEVLIEPERIQLKF